MSSALRPRPVLLLLLLPLALLLLLAWRHWQGPPLPGYQLETRPLVQRVVASGEVSSQSLAQVGSEITGVVARRAVREGDAVRAGVSAYVVDGLDPKRVKPVVEVARARFEDTQALRRELDEVSKKLSDRKLVDKAKGVLMKARGLDEDAAYHAMRKLAMERGQTMASVARDIIDMSRLLL